MRTQTLEILRPGPAHGQLLSPLTPYVALYGRHDAVTIHVPFEHQKMLPRLAALNYEVSGDVGEVLVRETIEKLIHMLAAIPGLTADLALPGAAPLHLQLTLSGSELALLPFELATSTMEMPGSPVTLTRAIRGLRVAQLRSPDRPRILFIAASPQEAGDIPFEEHRQALQRLVDPWVPYNFDGKPNYDEQLTVVSNATVQGIEKALDGPAYTHVHILAHGLPYTRAGDQRYGIALHDEADPAKVDVVDGEQLARLLFAGSCRPEVVTLATCHGSAGGTVIGPGGSVAHTLHSEGIPLVVASQFPLSFKASVAMVEILYQGFLNGEDPRASLAELRMRLRTRLPHTYDWASIVAYAAFPPDIDAQLIPAQIRRLRYGVNTAMDMADSALRQKNPQHKQFEMATHRIESLRDRLTDLAEATCDPEVELLGLLASMEKREAQIRLRWKQGAKSSIEKLLRRSRNYYGDAYRADRTATWALVQYLVLEALLANDTRRRFKPAEWAAAFIVAERDLNASQAERRVWALGSLIELHLLALLAEPSDVIPNAATASRRVKEYAKELNESRIQGEIYTTRMQLLRYRDMFRPWFDNDELANLAMTAFKILSKGITFS